MASQTSGTFAGASARYLALASTSQHRETLNRAVLPHGMARTSTRRRASRDRGILERLDEGAVLGDGGYLLELEKRGYVQAGPFTPEVSVTEPDALAELHREFLRAGAEVLQALTFYASEEKLATVGLAGRVDDINQAAVRVARSVAREGDALVAGNLSLTWAYDPADLASADRARALFDRPPDVPVAAGIRPILAP